MQTWDQVAADASVSEALHLFSGLAYITHPTFELVNANTVVSPIYLGFMNGLVGYTPRYFINETILPKTNPDLPPLSSCASSAFPIENPPPLGGYDCRCRSWFQQAKASGLEDRVQFTNVYSDYFNTELIVSLTHYFKLEGPGK